VDRGWEVTVNLGEGLPGKELLQLLSSIKEAGSLNRAAREAGLSYRYAWGLLNKVEETLGQRLVLRKAGGMAGGGTTLTDAGRRLLEYLLALQRETSLQMGAVLAGANQDKRGGQLVLASSMEPVVTGLLEVLEQAYLLQSGTVLRHVAAGSGQAFAVDVQGTVAGNPPVVGDVPYRLPGHLQNWRWCQWLMAICRRLRQRHDGNGAAIALQGLEFVGKLAGSRAGLPVQHMADGGFR